MYITHPVWYPGDLCCVFYEDNYYEGPAFLQCYDINQEGAQEYLLDPPVQANSWWCGKKVSYDFWDSSNRIEHRSGAGPLRSPVSQAKHPIGILTLNYFDPTTRGAVTAFADTECKGHIGRFDGPVDRTLDAYFGLDDLQNAGFSDNAISSVAVPWGYTVELFKDDGFVGDKHTVTGMESSKFGSGAAWCWNLRLENFGDQTSSLIVSGSGHGRRARGRWEVVNSGTEMFEFTYHIGMSTTSQDDQREG